MPGMLYEDIKPIEPTYVVETDNSICHVPATRCSKCGNVLECELFRQGHGIKQERINIREMVECQMEHKDKWQKTNQ